MKKIEHQLFLKNNAIDKKLLLQPIQEKIEIFNRMHALLKTVSDCEKGKLLAQLETLDLEIVEDIEQEYADRLAHNDAIEVPLKKLPTKEKQVEKKDIPLQKTEETIIDQLVSLGLTHNIGRSIFRKAGIKTALGWTTTVGKYRIIRTSVFSFKYKIGLN